VGLRLGEMKKLLIEEGRAVDFAKGFAIKIECDSMKGLRLQFRNWPGGA
jgi:hypothetical protein